MKKWALVFGAFGIMSLCSGNAVQISIEGKYSFSTSYKWYPIPDLAYWQMTGIISYDTDMLKDALLEQNDIAWRWSYQTQQCLMFDLMFTDGGDRSFFVNTEDYLYRTLTRYTAFDPSLVGQPPVYMDVFVFNYFDQPEHSGEVNFIEVLFSKIEYAPGIPDPEKPQLYFEPDYYKKTFASDYGKVKIGTYVYDSLGNYEKFYHHDFIINTCEVMIIPEPTMLALVGVGGMFIRRRVASARLANNQ